MKLLDKLKNTFFEEEYIEVEETPKKQTVVSKKIEPEVEEPEIIEEPVKEDFREEELLKKDNGFSYFEDEDFVSVEEKTIEPKPVIEKKEEIKKSYDNSVYGTKKINTMSKQSPYSTENVKTAFKPTPIISPIYGVLDKNYTKDEIIEKKEVKPSSSYVSRKNVDLDSIREKAFGTTLQNDFDLEEEKVETTYEEVEDDFDDNLLYDMTDIDKTPSVDVVTLQDAEEYFEDLGLEYNIDYKDTKYERATGRRVNRTPKIEEFEEITESEYNEEESEPIIIEEQQEDNISLEDDLFELIDSMYEEKE